MDRGERPHHVAEELGERVGAVEEHTDQSLRRHPKMARAMAVTRSVLREQGVEQVGLAASGAAFWLVISALPTAIAAVSLFGLVVTPEQVADDLGSLANASPGSLGSLITGQLRRVAATDHTGLTIGVVVSLLFAIWSASAGIYNLDRAVRDAYGLPRQRYAEARVRGFAGAFAMVVALGGTALAASAALTHLPTAVVAVVGTPVVLGGTTVAVGALYRFAVGQRMSVRTLLPGALVSAIGTVLLLAGFSVYASISTHYTAVYGSFAGAVIAMVATYLAVYMVLLGAVLNVELVRRGGPRNDSSRRNGSLDDDAGQLNT